MIMPEETRDAIQWALTQDTQDGGQVTVDMHHILVEKVREYFNSNSVEYGSFSYIDLIPFLGTQQ